MPFKMVKTILNLSKVVLDELDIGLLAKFSHL